jgi:hypothetical protein
MSPTTLTVLVVLILQAPDGSLMRFPEGLNTWGGCLDRVRNIAIERLVADSTRTIYTVNGAQVIAVSCEREDGE